MQVTERHEGLVHMRVIAGSARRLNLKTVPGNETRPTTDRIKETLFNMLQNDIPGCVFLDLFSGSGAIGIEALSRGAKKGYFVENNRACADCIRENLQFTKLADDGIVLECNVLSGIPRLESSGVVCDIIFMDPPYDNLLEKDVLERLQFSTLVSEDTLIIVEASLDTEFDYVSDYGFEIIKEKIYKTNKHVFIDKK